MQLQLGLALPFCPARTAFRAQSARVTARVIVPSIVPWKKHQKQVRGMRCLHFLLTNITKHHKLDGDHGELA